MVENFNDMCPFDEDIARGIFGKQCKQIEQLKQENEELKKLKCEYKNYCTCDMEKLIAENEQLKGKIKKIKEIADNQDLFRGRQALASKILQIIESSKE